jgi:hypothetical protein
MMPHLSVSSSIDSETGWVAAFVQRLRELGWLEGRNVAIEYRWAEGRNERNAEHAADLVRLKVDVIVTAGGDLSSRLQKKSAPVNPQSAIVAGHRCGGVVCPPTENARQFNVSRMPTGSTAAPEIAVVRIKSGLLGL